MTDATDATGIPSFATISIDIDDAIELSELLELVSDWLGGAAGTGAGDFERFFGSDLYSLAELACELGGWSTRLATTRIERAR